MSTPGAPRRSDPERNEATFIALFAMLGLALGLLALMAWILPGPIIAILGVIAFFGMTAVANYVVWGRWMSEWLRQTEAADEEYRALARKNDRNDP